MNIGISFINIFIHILQMTNDSIIYWIILFAILSYLLGSFSTAFWFGKWFGNIDIRQFGSKNAGATNVWRVLSFKIGILVFAIDIMKTFIAVQFVHFVSNLTINSEFYFQIKILFGICAMIGHIFPLYSSFKGGKGVASMFGIFFGLNPLIATVVLGFFIILVALSRIVSLPSICSAFLYLFITLFFNSQKSDTLTIFSIFICLVIVFTHRENIKRLIKREEGKLFYIIYTIKSPKYLLSLQP